MVSATPVLEATGPVMIPALNDTSKIFSWWDVNQREPFYIYGGYWLAEYASGDRRTQAGDGRAADSGTIALA